MSQSPDPNLVAAKRMLLTTRVMWFALIAGELMAVMGVALLISKGMVAPVKAEVAAKMLIVSWAMVLTAVPLGYFMRMQAYKKNWRADVIAPQGYLVGNLILWALCEACSLVTIAFALLEGTLWPSLVPSLVALSVQVYNFPDGRAMFPPGATPRASDAVE
jgi:hypothetical protein